MSRFNSTPQKTRLGVESLEDRLTPAVPVAVADTYTATEDRVLAVAVAQGVLSNDTPAGAPIRANAVRVPIHGVLNLALDGSFGYTPISDFAGIDTFSYQVADTNGVVGNIVTVTINVVPVNDAPTFTKGEDQAIAMNAGPQSVSGWAKGFSAGPGNESGQSVLAYEVVGNTNPALFTVAPTIAPDGTLTYTATGVPGTATITVVVRDSGGTANGGTDTSVPQQFSITVENAVLIEGPNWHPEIPTAVIFQPPRTVIAVGSPAGSLALARLIDSRTGAEVLRVEPFAGFRGGISVAAGDVNGDGTADLVVGAGAGGNTHVRAFDGTTGAELANFLAYRGFNGAVSVAVGDVNGDGFGDIVTGAGAGAPGGHVKAFNVVAHAYLTPAYVEGYVPSDGDYRPNFVVGGEEIASFLAFDSTFRGGVSVAAGDVNRDGFADIITGAGAGASNGHVKAFSGRTREQLASFSAYNGFTGGVRVSAADVNGDGVSEIVTQAVGTSHVKVFGADGSTRVSFQTYPSSGYSGFGLATADVNRDGIADIVTTGLTSGAPQLRAFRGTDVTPIELAYALPGDILGGIAVG
ncbi:Hemolysin-type calcium-binding region domain protein OS=Rhodopirellula maiorica SM1 GN=RMSM_03614 PE=4 SV=1: VCBS: FG-GAP: VCBS [Gemmata massiliana]|uniref:Uncharacterized protein n=1 Tax=Gemmata massiliana TaxID=1210884 RepID=A0A6P2CZH7_9BACT|nr:FG-GAP-like repeat-containing protein [Gemmata massiliana]VTR93766.1 Hemolysin-type calcium-binding region domain protein OS=Rhodopirellula maiorica SM1 GN=RMSM_03614 PE=4 SV=1: VCBS: FG-GAP: VCBS [Gemmata massiliana]